MFAETDPHMAACVTCANVIESFASDEARAPALERIAELR
jgi:hypothetical protein